MDPLKRENNDSRTKDFKALPGRGRNPFVGKDGKFNKVSIGLSAVSLGLVLSLGAYTLTGTSNLKSYRDVETATQIIDERIPLAIQEQYVDAINRYSEGELTYEEVNQYLATLIADYIESSGMFTALQTAELNSIIEQYLAGTEIFTDIEKNENSINAVSNLIGERYQANYDYITNVEASLKQLINETNTANTSEDDSRYQSLVKMDTNLQMWIDDASKIAHEETSETKMNLTDLIEELRAFTIANDDAAYSLTKAMSGAVDFAEGQSYEKGAYVFNDGKLYVANVDGATSLAEFAETDLETIISNLTLDMTSSFDEMRAYINKNVEDLQELVYDTGVDLQQNIDLNRADIENKLDTYKSATATYLDDMETALRADDSALRADMKKSDSEISTALKSAREALDSKIDLNDANTKTALKNGLDQANAYTEAVETALNKLDAIVEANDDAINLALENEAATRFEAFNTLSTNLKTTSDNLEAQIAKDKAELIANINTVATTSANDLDSAKNTLTDLINNNAELDKQTKEYLISTINSNAIKSSEDLTNLSNTLSTLINTTSESLTKLINDNASLSAEKRAELLANINEVATTSADNLDSAKSALTDLINDNSELDKQTKEYLISIINSNAVKSSEDLTNLSNTLSTLISTTNESLTKLINDNASLSAEKRAELLAIVNENDSNQKADVLAKYNALTKALGNESSSLKSSIKTLKDATEADIADLNTALNAKIDTNAKTAADNLDAAKKALTKSVEDLDAKHSTYFSKEVTLPVGTTTTLTGDMFKPYSNVNVVYSNTSGYTAKYDLTNGALAITLTKDASGSSPMTVNAIIYVDNSQVNTVEQ